MVLGGGRVVFRRREGAVPAVLHRQQPPARPRLQGVTGASKGPLRAHWIVLLQGSESWTNWVDRCVDAARVSQDCCVVRAPRYATPPPLCVFCRYHVPFFCSIERGLSPPFMLAVISCQPGAKLLAYCEPLCSICLFFGCLLQNPPTRTPTVFMFVCYFVVGYDLRAR